MQGCKPILAIQSVVAQELPDVNDATQYQLSMWMDNPRLAEMRLAPGAQIADKDRVLIRAACGLFKKFRAKMTEYGNQLFRPPLSEDDVKQALDETEAQKEKKIKKKRARSVEPKEEKEKKPRKKRVKKPEAPKRPISAYMRYVQDNRPAIVAAHPDAKFTDIGKMLGIKWAKMTEAEKQVYHDLTAKDKERYTREMQERGLKMDLY